MPNRTSTHTAPRTLAFALLASVCVSLFALPSALAQQADDSNNQLLKDFIHYVMIRNDELANAYGQALIDRGLTPVEFVALVEDSGRDAERFDRAIRAATLAPATEDVAAQLFRMFEGGKLERARNPEEVARNIQFLTENPRARLLASERLKTAGEYSVPQLLQVLQARANPGLETEVQRVLVSMGSNAVGPICAALSGVDAATQERLAGILGEIGRRTALPYLHDLRASGKSDPAKTAADRAIGRIAESADSNVAASRFYLALAEGYYNERPDLTSFPGEEFQLLWSFDPASGLFPTAIRTEVYHEARAMELAETVLDREPANSDAVALWIAANFSREIDSPEGYDNPAYPSDMRNATYYAVAAGNRITQLVLERALEDNDTPLARAALTALRPTIGGASVVDAKPLLDALNYPDRRVQYEAALALASARPTQAFPGSERVVPLLASAVRSASDRFAIVLASSPEQQQRLNELLTGEGYTVLAPAARIEDLAGPIAEASGIDLVITDIGLTATRQLVADLRNDPKLRATPVLAMLAAEQAVELRFDPNRDRFVEVARVGLTDDQLIVAAEQLSERSLGSAVSPEEATDYAFEALAALNDLAVSGGGALNPLDSARPLIAALDEVGNEDLRYMVATVLSNFGLAPAQVAIMDVALAAQGGEQIDYLAVVAESARRFGNQLQDRQVRALAQIASTGSDDSATAAAALMGALNLSDGQIAPLILGG